MKLLLERGADVNIVDDEGRTALMYAAEGKYVDAIPLLIHAQADFYTRNREGRTALDIATKAGRKYAVEILKAAMQK